MTPGDGPARATAAAVAQRSYGKLVAFLCARTRDVASAEDALAEAFASALATWPQIGCPANPEAWLLTVARRKLIDFGRRTRSGESTADALRVLAEESEEQAADREIPDRRLALMFACAHPAIDVAIRAPLMLQVLLGLDASMIAAAFLTSPSTMGQRLVRAKRKIREAGIPLAIPERDQLPERLDAVLDAIYAAFAQGWSDPVGTDVARRELAAEAIFLGRILSELLPGQPETLGLLALMLHAEARRRARRDAEGEFVPLAEQNVLQWEGALIEEAESLLLTASQAGAVGRFQLEAAVQSAHVHRRRTGTANWGAVLGLYDALLERTRSPVVAINRALALAEVEGVPAALAALQSITVDARLREYQPYWAARADLLARSGQYAAARDAYAIAIGLEADPPVRRFLQRRSAALPIDS